MNRNMPNYVSAGELVETQNQVQTVQSVWAVWLGNAGAGFGFGLIVAIVVNRALNFSALDTAIWGLCAGGLMFGALMVIRLSLDELHQAWEWQRMIADLDSMANENATLRDRIASLERDINYERLQRSARAQVPEPRRVDVMPAVDGARRDAETLLQRHFMGVSFARDVMVSNAGWTPTRWNEAMEILKAAGIAVTNGKRTVIQVATMVEAVDRLNGADEA
jgi:hypothetical protein